MELENEEEFHEENKELILEEQEEDLLYNEDS